MATPQHQQIGASPAKGRSSSSLGGGSGSSSLFAASTPIPSTPLSAKKRTPPDAPSSSPSRSGSSGGGRRGGGVDGPLRAMPSASSIGPSSASATPIMGGGGIASSPSAIISDALAEIKYSTELLFSTRLTWLLIAGPLALAGSVTASLPESTCFALAGLALVPCAERLSFVTEQVAAHTNGTIGALLNATFGNAPELLISTAALRAGYYRVIQLAMLGSILCNLLFVFGLSCLVGGLRWQVQDLRIVSGSVPIAVLLLCTAGVALPAALKTSGQIADLDGDGDIAAELIGFSRFNALVMMGAYLGYLTFQLGTHKDEYDDSEEQHERYAHHVGGPHGSPHGSWGGSPSGMHTGGWRKRRAQRNLFCRAAYRKGRSGIFQAVSTEDPFEHYGYDDDDCASDGPDVEMAQQQHQRSSSSSSRELPFRNEYIPEGGGRDGDPVRAAPQSHPGDGGMNSPFRSDNSGVGGSSGGAVPVQRQSSRVQRSSSAPLSGGRASSAENGGTPSTPMRSSRKLRSSGQSIDVDDGIDGNDHHDNDDGAASSHGARHMLFNGSKDGVDFHVDDDGGIDDDDEDSPPMSFRTGIMWLFVITLCISLLSDILVETIDGFALKMHISEVFTSVIVVPFFSNIAEQVSAVIFAYRNEMDLCVGITVGSAVQIALMVMPGCVLVGWAVDRAMSMYLRGYETCCLLIGVLLVSAVLQGGSTNWLSGLFFMIVYVMMAAGFWFHELEVLDVDAEEVLKNTTAGIL